MPASKEVPFFCDFAVLYRDRNFLKFRPFCGDTVAERINSACRFMLYVVIGCVLWQVDAFICIAYITTLLIFVIFGKSNPSKPARSMYREKQEELVKRPRNAECRMPTDDNPFGNFMVTDFDDPDRPPACDPEDVQEEIDSKFYKNLYRNVDDLYEKESSARQFYTNPVTAVCNDQVEFARALYQDVGSKRRHGLAY